MARCEEGAVKSPPRVRSRVSSARTQTLFPSQADTSNSNPKPPPAASSEAAFATKLVAFDRRFSKWVHENCLSELTYAFLRIFEYSGDGLFWIPATALLWLTPSSWLAPEIRAFALNLFVCLLFDLIVVGAIKYAVGRQRPQYNRGHLVIVAMDHYSFPSGHSTRAAMLLTLFWLHTPLWQSTITQALALNPTWKTLSPNPNSAVMGGYKAPLLEDHGVLLVGKCVFGLWMLATCCARVVLGRHYLSDVVGGVVVGVLEGVLAHFALHVPVPVSELHHGYVMGLVVGFRVIGGRHGFGESMERLIDEAHEGVL